jgi:hypothetical protein
MSWLAIISLAALLYTCLLVFGVVVIVVLAAMAEDPEQWRHEDHWLDPERNFDTMPDADGVGPKGGAA